MAVKKSYNRYFIIFQEEDKGYGIAIDKQPTGYTKIENRSGKCKITVYAQNLIKEKGPYYCCLVDSSKDPLVMARLGAINIDDTGRGETWWEFKEDDVAETGVPFDRFNVAAVITEENKVNAPLAGYIGKDKVSWKDRVPYVSRHEEKPAAEAPIEEELVPEKEPAAKVEAEETEELDEEAKKFKEYEEDIKSDNENEGQRWKKDKDNKENTKSENKEKSEKKEEVKGNENKAEKKAEAKGNENKAENKKENLKAEAEKTESKKDNPNKPDNKDNKKENQKEVENANPKAAAKENPKEEKKDDPKPNTAGKPKEEAAVIPGNQPSVIEPFNYDEDIEAKEVSGYMNDSFNKNFDRKGDKDKRPFATMFHDILEDFDEEEELTDEFKNTKWWKIPLSDDLPISENIYYPYYCAIYHLKMTYPYINYIKYFKDTGHYHFGMKYDDSGEVKYILYGIEANNSHNSQPYMGMTGFIRWIKMKNDDKGMWIMYYNPHTGNIMIPKKR